MSQVTTISGRGLPLTGNDIDTDRIIPARFLRCVTFDGLGDQAFVDDRAQAQGQHPFDLPQYRGAKILVVNGNFGCGSSREHAPQAIAHWGIEAIVGESFAEIFAGNCLAMGIPCVTAEAQTIQHLQELLHQTPQTPIQVNLETMQVHCGEFGAALSLGDGPRQMLLTGTWDACGQLLAHQDQIRTTAAQLPYLGWTTFLKVA
jgi:3-isopropylmalate/(R)-2-methylmalate dehydratase small subunit